MAESLANDHKNLPLIKRLDAAMGLVKSLPFQVNLWRTQNIFYEMFQHVNGELRDTADHSDKQAKVWIEHFRRLGEKLYVHVE
jgi:hypothetical protein